MPTDADYKAARIWLSHIDVADPETVEAAANFHAGAREGAEKRISELKEILKAALEYDSTLTVALGSKNATGPSADLDRLHDEWTERARVALD